ncbi:hypothetical protein DB88DRAFT_483668 [Papiliotrema laurentii]|uniref:Conidiation-specific protein 6 n=1 Tax=Papiliotrema laurentii TaxID=5418 RepID=A0AAD9FSG6_PAPLA|nr:hypothetical protein DB88DRAFT_483668 [Papiliotrema laurentii]
MTDQNENRTLGGYKATLHNPNTSEGAKHHAAELLQAHGETLSQQDAAHLKHAGPEGHSHHGVQHHVSHHADGWKDAPVADKGEGGEHDHRVLGGFKATLSNPNSSEEAKEHAAEVLVEHGERIDL